MEQLKLFEVKKPIIGMVHLPPLPGAPKYRGASLRELITFALDEAKALEEGGVDGIIVENFHDYPYLIEKNPLAAVIAISIIAHEVKTHVSTPVGVNILFNDVEHEMYVASTVELDFVRIEGFVDFLFSDLGILAPASARVMRLKNELPGAQKIAVLADIQGKYTYAFPQRSLLNSARDALERGGADAVIVTGESTGQPVRPETVKSLRDALPDARIIIGSGLTPDNVQVLLSLADGAIVGTYFKKDGLVTNRIDPQRVRKLMGAVKAVRKAVL